MRILAVDDDPTARIILKDALDAVGVEHALCADGEDAWRLFEEEPFEVVISDWLMPKVDGLELCRRVRSITERGYTYFIVLSALGDRADLVRGLEAGADDYLIKPLDTDELRARLISAERVTSLHRTLREQAAELERLNAVLREQARTDALTGVANRLAFNEAVEAIAATAADPGASIALCDLDGFKAYNDTYGHLAGDDALVAVADALKRVVGAERLFRYGGEEFLLVLPGAEQRRAVEVVERAIESVEALDIPHEGRSSPSRLTASAGVATVGDGGAAAVTRAISRADDALYDAKRAGGNRVGSALRE